MQQRMRMGGGGFGLQITPLVRNALIFLITVYVVELVALVWLKIPLDRWLFLNSMDSGLWRPWQPLTALLLNTPSPLNALLNWLMLVFFLGPVEDLMGRKKMLYGLLAAAIFAGFATTVVDAMGLASAGQFVGLHPLIGALVLFFGLSLPNATINLMFVLPIKAAWVAWGSGLIALLVFLAAPSLGAAMGLFGWVGAFLWLKAGPDQWQRLRLRWRARQTEKELERFTVIRGGRDDDEDYIH